VNGRFCPYPQSQVKVSPIKEELKMATGRSSFAKRQRDMAKKAKAAAKREKRLDKSEFADDPDSEADDSSATLSNDDVMARIAELHRRYDDGEMDFETFDEQRVELMAQISVD